MKKVLSASAMVILTACVGPIVASPGEIAFVARDDGIEGSYDPSVHSKSRVESRVGEYACQSGILSNYSEQLVEGGTVSFTALCDGENTYEGFAGFTLRGPQATGFVIAEVNDRLVQVTLN